MKHLFNLSARELDGYITQFDRVVGEPQQFPGSCYSLDDMQRMGWRGIYSPDTTILSRHELLEKGKENYRAGIQEWLKAPMETADEMLNAVPPAMQRGSSFATGEPWTHDGRGREVYLCFRGFDWASPVCEAQYLNLTDFVALLTARR